MIQPGSKVVCIMDFKQFDEYWYLIQHGLTFNIPFVDEMYVVRGIYQLDNEEVGVLLVGVDNTHLIGVFANFNGEIGFGIQGFREVWDNNDVDQLLEVVFDAPIHPDEASMHSRLGEFLYRY